MLELRGLCARYGSAPALVDVSLAVAGGELVCVVGPNGAGKTTLIDTIAGLHKASAGTMTIDGIDLTVLPPHRFCAYGIALVPEGRRLFGRMSVRENLDIGRRAMPINSAPRVSEASALDAVLTLFPDLRDKLDAPASSLSGGQQQMVAIARALMAKPRLLLLDEPSLGLSPRMVSAMFRAIRDVHASGTAVLLVEQNVAAALELADRAYLLEEGRIVAQGSADEMMRRPDLRRAYLGIASGG
ncbi:MAG TPA: ABC transporter ATP-binding protein [Casimicrobiaceae bacterium]|nr:ABC transporter ATP-binding protein [Casimicrobiaceae bacterium]